MQSKCSDRPLRASSLVWPCIGARTYVQRVLNWIDEVRDRGCARGRSLGFYHDRFETKRHARIEISKKSCQVNCCLCKCHCPIGCLAECAKWNRNYRGVRSDEYPPRRHRSGRIHIHESPTAVCNPSPGREICGA